LRGCLEISEEFAAEFLETTAGWHPEDEIHEDSVVKPGDVIPDQIPLVNDRHHDKPIYVRGDSDWSRKKSAILDRLIHKHRPDLIPQRTACKKKLKKKKHKKRVVATATVSSDEAAVTPTIQVEQ